MKATNTIKNKIIIPLLFFIILILNGCNNSGTIGENDNGNKKALTTINIIADFVGNVAGDKMDSVSLLPVGSDPHVYEPVPRDVQEIVDSDLVFYNGYNLEKWMEELLENAGGIRQSHQVTANLEPMRDQRNDPDPHLWMDPVYAVSYVESIKEVLMEFDPENAEYYEKNAEGYINQLKELNDWIKARVEEIPEENRKLVTTHDAYAYFGIRYGFKVVGSIWGITTEDEPSAQEVAALVDGIKTEDVQAAFVETTINPKLMERVAKDAGIELGKALYGDSLGLPGSGADTYIGMMRTNVNNIVEALK
tara:strand:- start:5368 stop:6288 length:921 start_codon:yes stop_codon:yes gene_type:complete